jgi:hypothetical protein
MTPEAVVLEDPEDSRRQFRVKRSYFDSDFVVEEGGGL